MASECLSTAFQKANCIRPTGAHAGSLSGAAPSGACVCLNFGSNQRQAGCIRVSGAKKNLQTHNTQPVVVPPQALLKGSDVVPSPNPINIQIALVYNKSKTSNQLNGDHHRSFLTTSETSCRSLSGVELLLSSFRRIASPQHLLIVWLVMAVGSLTLHGHARLISGWLGFHDFMKPDRLNFCRIIQCSKSEDLKSRGERLGGKVAHTFRPRNQSKPPTHRATRSPPKCRIGAGRTGTRRHPPPARRRSPTPLAASCRPPCSPFASPTSIGRKSEGNRSTDRAPEADLRHQHEPELPGQHQRGETGPCSQTPRATNGARWCQPVHLPRAIRKQPARRTRPSRTLLTASGSGEICQPVAG